MKRVVQSIFLLMIATYSMPDMRRAASKFMGASIPKGASKKLLKVDTMIKPLSQDAHKMVAKYPATMMKPLEMQPVSQDVPDSQEVPQDVFKQKLTEVYSEVVREVDFYAQKFASETQKDLKGIQRIAQFDQVVADELKSFEGQMSTVRQRAIDNYNQFLEEQGHFIDPFELTKEQRELSVNVRKITQESIDHMHSIVQSIRAQLLEKSFARGFAQRTDEDQPEAVITDSEVDYTTSIMKSFVAKLTQHVLEESGDKVLKEVGVAVRKKTAKSVKGLDDVIPKGVKEQIDKFKGAVDSSSMRKWFEERGVTSQALKHAIKFAYPVPISEKMKKVSVQTTTDLSDEENTFLTNRLPKVQQVLQESFNIDVPLRIAFCCSGGGNRAMIGTLGLFTAAARHHFLQASTYMAGLSGSTWMMAPWCYMSMTNLLSKDYRVSLKQLSDMLMRELNYQCALQVCPAPMLDADTNLAFAYSLAKRFAYDKPITAVDIHGALIGNYALDKVGHNRLEVTWSSIARKVQQGELPLPICTAAIDLGKHDRRQKDNTVGYRFFETNPFEGGCPDLGYIPIETLGSKFEGGVMSDRVLEYPLSFYLGVYGSAFSIAMNDVLDRLPRPKFDVLGHQVSVPVNVWVEKAIGDTNKNIRAQRADKTYARFSNYTFDMDDSPIDDQEMFALFDAGIFINLPMPPLFERPDRKVDVVILYDSNPESISQLHDLAKLFKRKGIQVPDMSQITKKEFLEKPMLVFNDPRLRTYKPLMPTVLYFRTPNQDISKFPYNIDLKKYPDIKMPIDTSKYPYITLNFAYPPKYFKNLSQTMEAVFESQVPAMRHILQAIAEKKPSEEDDDEIDFA